LGHLDLRRLVEERRELRPVLRLPFLRTRGAD
jgi:hypothetical protein